MIFIDRNGEKYEPEIVNAVLNGVEIDTQAHVMSEQRQTSNHDKSSTDKTIDI